MFEFESLLVYQKARAYNQSVIPIIEDQRIRLNVKDQLSRASFSIMLNIAEGTGRFTKRDKRNFYVISRGSVFECVSVFHYLLDIEYLDNHSYSSYYNTLEELSKMLFKMIRSLE